MFHGEKITLQGLRACKSSGRKFSVLTCYDASTARLMDAAGVEVLLVGDTAAEVILGLPSTREIPAEFLLTLTEAVRRGASRAMVMADLPYVCRCGDDRTTVRWAQRFMEETGCDFVKVEVSGEYVPLVESMYKAGVPVVAHLGLLPQMLDPSDGYPAQGRDAESARELIENAKRFEDAGAVCLLLEAVASEVSQEIATHTDLPVIGCVAGPHCDGTVVVLHDMIGWGGGHPPRLVKRYEDLAGVLTRAFTEYVDDIHAGRFPTDRQSIHMKPGELEKLTALTGNI